MTLLDATTPSAKAVVRFADEMPSIEVRNTFIHIEDESELDYDDEFLSRRRATSDKSVCSAAKVRRATSFFSAYTETADRSRCDTSDFGLDSDDEDEGFSPSASSQQQYTPSARTPVRGGILVSSADASPSSPPASPPGQWGKGKRQVSDEPSTFSSNTWDVLPPSVYNNGITVMFRNVPPQYTRADMVELIDMDFANTYDFFYLPLNFKKKTAFGYALVNFLNLDIALEFVNRFDGFSDWIVESDKVASVTISLESHGLKAQIERYRNSPIMHPSVPDEFKPIILYGGVRVPFPPPAQDIIITKKTNKDKKSDTTRCRRI